jgi:hypothetical protein
VHLEHEVCHRKILWVDDFNVDRSTPEIVSNFFYPALWHLRLSRQLNICRQAYIATTIALPFNTCESWTIAIVCTSLIVPSCSGAYFVRYTQVHRSDSSSKSALSTCKIRCLLTIQCQWVVLVIGLVVVVSIRNRHVIVFLVVHQPTVVVANSS